MKHSPQPIDLNQASREDLSLLPNIDELVVGASQPEPPLSPDQIPPIPAPDAPSSEEPDATAEPAGSGETALPSEAAARFDLAPTVILETDTAPEPLILEAAPQPGTAAAGADMLPGEARPARTVIPPAMPQPAAPPRSSLSRKELAVWLAGASLFTLLLAVALSLGVLRGVNGGLSYASPAQIRQLELRISGLDSQSETLQQDLQALAARLDTLQGLSSRVATVERESSTARTRLDDSLRQVSEMNAEIEKLQAQVNAMQEKTTLYEQFLQGLRKLLGDLPTP